MPDSICGGAEEHPAVRWSFDLGSGVVPWVDPSPPDPGRLRHARWIRSRSGAGHVPTWAYSLTLGRHLRLESGLEHDLVRVLDHDPEVAWLVSQPAVLSWQTAPKLGRRSHIPDMLSVSTTGAVVLWDVRPAVLQDARFLEQSAVTRSASRAIGWGYQVFSGLDGVHRANLMWLDGFRRDQPWYAPALAELEGGPITLGEVVERDGGGGHLISAIWNALRVGTWTCDLTAPLTRSTVLDRAVGADL